MTFNTSPRETISRADHYYNNQFRVYAEEPRLREARCLEASRDVIEPESVRLERMMMQRFQKGIFLHSGTSVQFVKKVGKFVFVAVIFPPYFAVYLAPKWVFQVVLPLVSDMAKSWLEKFTGIVGGAANWVMHISGLLFKRFNDLFKISFKVPERVIKNSKDFIQKLFSEYVKKPFSRLSRKMKDAAEKQKKKFKGLWDFVREKLAKVVSRLTPSFSLTFRMPKIPPLPRLPQFSWPKISLLPFKEGAFKVLQSLKRLSIFKKVLLAIGLFFWDILLLNYQNWIEPYIQWVAPLSKRIQGHLIHFRDKVFEKMVKSQMALKGLGEAVFALYTKVEVYLKLKVEPFFQKIQKGWQRLKSPLLRLAEKRSTLIGKMKVALISYADEGGKGIATLLTFMKQFPLKIYRALDNLGKRVLTFFTELFKAFRLTYILIKVLIRIALQSLRSVR